MQVISQLVFFEGQRQNFNPFRLKRLPKNAKLRGSVELKQCMTLIR